MPAYVLLPQNGAVMCLTLYMERLSLRGQVDVLSEQASDKEKRTRPFRMVANTGQPFGRWFGRAVVDLSGIEPLRARGLPMLLGHDDRQPAGIATSATLTDEGLVLEGDLLLRQKAGQQVSELSDDGFPLTASIGIRVLSREEVEEGVIVEVNGQEIKGPIEVWRQSALTETSFLTANPADPNTVAEALEAQEACLPGQEAITMLLKEVLESTPEEWHGLAARLLSAGKTAPEIREGVLQARLTLAEGERDAALAEAARILSEAKEFPLPPPSAATLAKLKESSGHPGVSLKVTDDPVDLSSLPVIERARREWDASRALQGEFLGNFNAYLQIRMREEVVA